VREVSFSCLLNRFLLYCLFLFILTNVFYFILLCQFFSVPSLIYLILLKDIFAILTFVQDLHFTHSGIVIIHFAKMMYFIYNIYLILWQFLNFKGTGRLLAVTRCYNLGGWIYLLTVFHLLMMLLNQLLLKLVLLI